MASDGASFESTASLASIDPVAGRVIAGRYELLEKLGEGGMGEVWVAKQSDPVKRKVALKLVKKGMDSKAVLQRFEQERQALAVMDHPHIAKVHDGGLTELGQPYFVMELVDGAALTRFCDDSKLSLRERLDLFVPVCHAVQHAHQKGIIHRDLKPANVLVAVVDGKPIPKVIDFGVAKAVSGRLTEETLSTHIGAVVGTLEYMAPEQAGLTGADIDTRADVYSLGVILYELLTGLRPFDSKRLRSAALDEMIRIIREEDPPSLSSRLSTDESLPNVAAVRGTEPRLLVSQVKGELDWIVQRCLEKDRNRRYDTANALAREIQRYLADEPVEARPTSARYRLKKFIRRNKGPLLSMALLLGALIGGATFSGWQAFRALQAERRAEELRSRDEASFRQAKKAVDEFAAQAVDKLRDVPGAQAAREEMLRTALNYYRAFLHDRRGDDQLPLEIATTLFQLGNVTSQIGSRSDAQRLYEESLVLWEQFHRDSPLDPKVLNGLGSVCNNYAILCESEGRPTEAKQLHQRALQYRESLSTIDPNEKKWQVDLAASCNNLASQERGEARRLYARAVEIRERLLRKYSDDSELVCDLAETYNNLGELQREHTEFTAAFASYQRGIDLVAVLLRQHPGHLRFQSTLAHLQNGIAAVHLKAGAPDDALRFFDLSRDVRARMIQENPRVPIYRRDLARTLNNISILQRDGGRLAAALKTADEACGILECAIRDHPRDVELQREFVGVSRHQARICIDLRKPSEALRSYQRACTAAEFLVSREPSNVAFQWELASSLHNLAAAHLVARQPTDAVQACLRARPLRERLLRDEPQNLTRRVELATTLENLGLALLSLDRSVEAASAYQDAVEHRRAQASDSSALANALHGLSHALVKAKRHVDAESSARECIRLFGETSDRWSRFRAEAVPGASLLGQEKLAEAESALVRGFDGMKARETRMGEKGATHLPETMDWLIGLYTATKKPDEVKKWKAERAKYPAQKTFPVKSSSAPAKKK